jgi:hypothetical protein
MTRTLKNYDDPGGTDNGSGEIEFSDGSTRFFCKVFFSEQFEALRQNCGFSEKYITSLASSVEWDSSGGKSGSAFLKTTGRAHVTFMRVHHHVKYTNA